HDAHYRTATSCLVLVGHFDSGAAADLLGSFELPQAVLPSPWAPLSVGPAATTAAGIRVVDVAQTSQTELRVGHAGVARDNEDLPPLEVLNAILGRGPSSRLA